MPTPPPYDDIELFQRIAEGNEQAFTQLFDRYTPKLLHFVTKLTRNEHQARELVQETFLRLWVHREELPDVKMPSAYIYRIASNTSLGWLKQTKNRRRIINEVVQPDNVRTPGEHLDTKELTLIIANTVNLLPEKRQEIYRLSREKGLSHQEIADKLGISLNTVKNQIGMALKFLQENISNKTGLSVITVAILLGI